MSLQSCCEKIYQQHVDRIKGIEAILQDRGFDKAPLAIVHAGQEQRQEHHELHFQKNRACNTSYDQLFAQAVHQQNKDKTNSLVICMHVSGNEKHDHKQRQTYQRFVLKTLKATHGQITQQQGEHHILSLDKNNIVSQHQVERDFGKKCKDKKADAVFLSVFGFLKAFYKQKHEDGESKPAEHLHQMRQRHGPSRDGEPNFVGPRIAVKPELSQVIRKHGDAGN